MKPAEEEYVHYAECCDCLNRAWSILQDVRRGESSNVLHYAAFRYALVEYAKPYTRADGTHRSGRRAYKLPAPTLSREDAALHQEIIDARNSVLAHSDLTLKDASVLLTRFDGRPSAIIGQNTRLDLPSLDSVVQLIERTLDIMYREKGRLVDALNV